MVTKQGGVMLIEQMHLICLFC